MNIQKTIKYLIVGLVIIVFGFLAFYLYINTQTGGNGEDFADSEKITIFGGLFGGGKTDTTNINNNIPAPDDKKIEELPKLRKISNSPVAGFFSFQNEKNKEEILIRYIEKATGHIYEANDFSSSKKRISNTTIPKIQEALWLDKSSFVIRYLDDFDNIKTFFAQINETEETSKTDGKTINEEEKIEGVFLQNDIQQVVKAGDQIFYLIKNTEGSRGILSDTNGEKKIEIFNSPLTELLVQRPKKGLLAFTTKPSVFASGYLYFFDTKTEEMRKILGLKKGLTTSISSDGEKILFSESTDSSFTLNLYNIEDNSSEKIVLATLPEKCVWAENNQIVYCGVPTKIAKGEYPDEWYQGVISFTDDIWKIDLENQIAEILVSVKELEGAQIDLIKPALSHNERFLFFVNKKDSSLWSLELK
ncbi:hypothetical protein KKG48_01580 [Patescibacteria group bacterium]|nr:hypothetical protein [Patescibacteria group bacterium]MCG2695266.1 hypothetical protein [Candidatus Parcubacteria bacterium]